MKKLPALLLAIALLTSCDSKTDTQEKDTTEVAETPQEEQGPTNIILMIGDGMGLSQISAGMISNNNTLQLERFPYIGLSKTSSSDNLITDSAAGATALASGQKTYNGAIGVDKDKNPLETILEIAAKRNLNTGLIATSSITHATPACFYSHQPSRTMDEAIAMDMVKSPVDLFLGGGKDFFEKRADHLNLLDSLKAHGFSVYDEVADVDKSDTGKVACFIAAQQPQSYTEGRGDFLPQASEKAVNILANKKGEGFFMMIEGSQIDWGGHANDSDMIIAEMKDFNNAIGKVIDFAAKDGHTLVIVTADHETGGYSIIGGSKEDHAVKGAFTTDYHTATMVPVFAYGPGAEDFAGIYENTAIYEKMLALMKK